jgi:hypothetical protein
MATNVSYASNDANLTSLLLHILPDFGKHGDGIINSNLLTAALKLKGAVQNVEGGLEFWYGIMKQENSNAQWQGKNDDMNAAAQDPDERLRFEPKVYTSSIVLNALDRARNRGRAAIKNYLMELRQQAITTNENQFNSAWWDTSGGTGDLPESIPTLISATPTTGTIGGLNRAGNSYLQNGAYTTAISDIGSEAGIAKMIELQALYAVGQSMADLIIMSAANWAGLAGYLAANKRFKAVDPMTELKIKTIDLGDAMVGFENTNVLGGANTITSNYMYGINTKYMKLKHLVDPGAGKNGWGTDMERVGRSLNKAVYYTWFGNLTTNNPRAHFVATSVSTS